MKYFLTILLCVCILSLSWMIYVYSLPQSIDMEAVKMMKPMTCSIDGNIVKETKSNTETICYRQAHYETLNNEKVLIMGNSLSVGMNNVDEDKYDFIAKGSATLRSTRLEGRYEQIKDSDFETVIICFGTNAMYWDLETWQYEFGILFEEIYKVNPNADIVISTPPPFSKALSDRDGYLTNKNVKRCSEYFKQIAEENNVYYLDCSKLFGDVLDDSISGDGVHLTSKWYKIWLEFLIEETGKMEKLVFDE